MEQFFPVVLFIVLQKVVLTFESVHEIPWCDHSNGAALSYGTVYIIMLYNVVLTFEFLVEILRV